MSNVTATGSGFGDPEFNNSFRNPSNLVGKSPNATRAGDFNAKYLKIVEQRERILESFMAEHAGLLPSQIRQVCRELPNGDVCWHVERIV